MIDIGPYATDVPPLTFGDVQLWPVSADVDDDRVADLSERLAPDELARADRLRVQIDRATCIVSHVVLRTLLAAHRGTVPERIALDRDVGGKPRLRGGGGPHFSLSRSSDRALIAIASHEVGVDIEAVRDVDDCEAVARRYFTAREAGLVADRPTPDRADAFLACWTRKEAVVKATGLGLSLPLNGFEVGIDHAPMIVRPAGATAWSLRSGRDGGAHFAAAVVGDGARFRLFDRSETARYARLP